MAQVFGITGAFTATPNGTVYRSLGPIPLGARIIRVTFVFAGASAAASTVAAAVSASSGANAANLQSGTPLISSGDITQDGVRAFEVRQVANGIATAVLAVRIARITQTSYLIIAVANSASVGDHRFLVALEGEILEEEPRRRIAAVLELPSQPPLDPISPALVPPGGGPGLPGGNIA